MASYNQPITSQPTQQIQQQSTILEYLHELITKRVSTIQYLSQTHLGNTHWFNTILLTKDDLDDISCNFYTLGVSLGNLLDINNPIDFVKALVQLLAEFEIHTADNSRQKMKNIFRKTKTKDENNVESGGEYVHLIVPHVPYELNYFEVFFTLCDALIEVYQKFMSGIENNQYTQSYFELVLKCDGKIKKLFSMITKELDALARNAIKDELKLIDPLSFSNKVTPIDFESIE
ncbi:unnamed protein product [Cunninghamella blakesleeana]